QATGDTFYRRIAEETLDYVARDMTAPEGGFYSAEDADSEGVEGKFYVWTLAEIEDALDPDEARLAMRFWDVTERGNFEGKNILSVPRPPEAVAAEFSISIGELWSRILGIRQKLFAEREKRVRPGRDEKVLAAWNGLMLRAFAFAARVLEREDYRRIAEKSASFLLEKLRVNGRLRRSYKDGRARFNGYLEDYACVADGLLALYEATFQTRWLAEAGALADDILELFWDDERGVFYDTAVDHEELVTRPRDIYDSAAPSGNSVAVDVLLKLSVLLDREDYRRHAETVLEGLSGVMARISGGFGRLLSALDFYLSTPYEVVLIGDPDAPDTGNLLSAVYSAYLPNKVVAGRSESDEEAAQLVPLLADRPMRDGEATAYVCVQYACQSPTTDPEELKRQLGVA
ncbi:MAG TPA: thioredoxin domain-containing protein, partial [Rubrobacteraceae bacterium]|nr:thioredoxin domain-containing protein [Rubrobacteraceae bacterium]